MQVKLWGIRGSCPAPLKRKEFQEKMKKIIYSVYQICKDHPNYGIQEVVDTIPSPYKKTLGGNTTCIEVYHEKSKLIFDMGTGLRLLGKEIVKQDSPDKELHILITHTHWDHIQGWPFFAPAFDPTYTIQFYSAIKDLESRLEAQQQSTHFPVSLGEMKSKKKFRFLKKEEVLHINPFQISTLQLIHPGRCSAYKISVSDKTFIFATDTELSPEKDAPERKAYLPFFQNADLVVLDAQYSLKEAESSKGWGHTGMLTAVDYAQEWGIKNLILTHHDPEHDDMQIYSLFQEAREYLKSISKAPSLRLYLAREGDIYNV